MSESEPRVKTPKILIIDDDIYVVKTIIDRLQSSGFETDVAYDEHIAKKKIEDNFYDLLIVDIKLKSTSGISLIEKMRNEIISKRMNVIILTAQSSEENAIAALKTRLVDDYLLKVNAHRELIPAVKEVLSQPKKLGPLPLLSPDSDLLDHYKMMIEDLKKDKDSLSNELEKLKRHIQEGKDKISSLTRIIMGLFKELKEYKGDNIDNSERNILNNIVDRIKDIIDAAQKL